MDLNYLDWTVGALIILLALKGLLNGFSRELFGFLGLIGGVLIASRTALPIARYIDVHFVHLNNFAALKTIAFLLVLGAIWWSVSTIGSLLLDDGKGIHDVSGISRAGGFILAGMKYFLVFSFIISALFRTPLVKENAFSVAQKSKIYPYLNKTGTTLLDLAPIASVTKK